MISAIDHFTDSLYNDAWATSPSEITAYIMYANAVLDNTMRRKFKSLYRPEANYSYAPLLAELSNAGVIISPEPYQYAPSSIPRGVAGVEGVLNRDLRYNGLIPMDVDEVARMCKVIAGVTVRSGYRAHPNTFAQMQEWDYDDPGIDERMCALKWAEEDWREGLLMDVEVIYYQLMEVL